jgi:hypothetical protein
MIKAPRQEVFLMRSLGLLLGLSLGWVLMVPPAGAVPSRVGDFVTWHGTRANTGNLSVTVPPDAQVMTCLVDGFSTHAGFFSGGKIRLGGAALQLVAGDTSTAAWQGTLGYKVQPPTGSQLLSVNWLGTSQSTDPWSVTCAFYTNVDLTNPLRSTSCSQSVKNPHGTALLDALPGDLAIAWAFQFVVDNEATFSWTNALPVADFPHNLYGDRALAETQPQADLTIGVSGTSAGTGDQDGGICALVLAGTDGAPPPPPPPPPSSGYPDATNTGVPPGTALTVVNGDVTLNTAGMIYENKDVRGCITVNAPNVTIRTSKVLCTGLSAIWSGSTNLLVEDVEADCGNAVGRTAITPQNYTARRVNAHGCENIFWAEGAVLIEDSYIHDPVPYDPVLQPHTDSVQIPQGAGGITIRHNRIYGGYRDQSNFGNSAVTMGGGTSNIVLDDNILAGGGYTLYCNVDWQGGPSSGNQYINNRFSTVFVSTVGGFGPMAECADEPVCSGNVYHETGQAFGVSVRDEDHEHSCDCSPACSLYALQCVGRPCPHGDTDHGKPGRGQYGQHDRDGAERCHVDGLCVERLCRHDRILLGREHHHWRSGVYHGHGRRCEHLVLDGVHRVSGLPAHGLPDAGVGLERHGECQR